MQKMRKLRKETLIKIAPVFLEVIFDLVVLGLIVFFISGYSLRKSNLHHLFYKTTEITSAIGIIERAVSAQMDDVPNSARGYQTTVYIKSEFGFYIISVFQKKDEKWKVVDYEILETTENVVISRFNHF